MNTRSFPRLILFLLLLLLLPLLLSACRQSRPQPTPTPTLPPATPTTVVVPPTATPPPPVVAEPVDRAPRVIGTSPQPGQESSLGGAITIRFDQAMDAASVEQALVITRAGQSAEGALQWPRPDTLIFTPATGLEPEQEINVQIAESARSATGKPLHQALRLNFVTQGYLAVSQIIPAPDTVNASPDEPITLFFNRPVVPLTSTTQQGQLPQPLTIEPPVAGTGQWLGTTLYRFVPDEPLVPGQKYLVRVSADLTDITGSTLATPFEATFQTAPPRLVSITPELNTPLDPTGTLTLTFNVPMDATTTQASLSISPAAQYSTTWSNDNRILTLSFTEPLALGTRHILSLETAAKALYGDATLPTPARRHFNTWPLPAVENSYPAHDSTVDQYEMNYYSGVNIDFASPMDWETLDGQVTITPAPDPDRVSYDFWSGNSLRVSFPFAYETRYTVTVPASATDRNGNALAADYTFSFNTPKPPPLASFNLPFNITQLSTAFPSDVTLFTQNISSATVRLYDFAQELPDQALFTPYRYDRAGWRPVGLVWERSITPESSPQTVTLPLADGGMLPTGVYYLDVTGGGLSSENNWWQNQGVLLVVADTNLVIKESPETVTIWATDLETGQPKADLDLTLYLYDTDARRVAEEVARVRTDADGLAIIGKDFVAGRPDYQFNYSYRYPLLAVAGAPGAPGFGVTTTQFNSSVQPWSLGVSYNPSAESQETLYLFTDRPIYRPGDTLYLRGWLRTSGYGRYSPPATTTLDILVSNYNDSKKTTLTFEVDETGGFSGEFVIPADQSLGTVTFSPTKGEYAGNPTAYVTVAEFRKPELLVTVTPQQPELVRGEPVRFTVSADYFFGAPAPDLSVQWTLTRNTLRLPWESGPYSFTTWDSWCCAWDSWSGNYYGQWITSDEGRTDSDGKLVVEIPADVVTQMQAGGHSLTLEAMVTDASQTMVSANGTLQMHAAERYVGIKSADYSAPVGQSTPFDLLTVDQNRTIVPNLPVEVVFLERSWKSRPQGQEIIWETVDTEIGRETTSTNAAGEATIRFTPEKGGFYLIRAAVQDAAGRTNQSDTGLWVYGGLATWRSDSRDRKMDLVPDQRSYTPGDTASLLVQSPFAGPVTAWLTIERGEIIEQRLITLETTSDRIAIPVTADYAPNVFVTLTAVKGVDGSASPYADMRYGVAELIVDPVQLLLNVAITTPGEVWQPRDSVTWEISTTNWRGEPVSADITLALVDLAILTLKQDTTPTLEESFYARQPLRTTASSGLFISGEGWPELLPDMGPGGMGGGGGGMDELAAFDLERSSDDDVRRDFRDTAFWEARVRTDAGGKATVNVILPDNLTTWRMTARAVSADTLVGQTTHDIIATRLLLVRPVTPRFFTVGDRAQIGAVVNNNSNADMPAAVSLEGSGYTLTGDAVRNVTVPARGSTVVRWDVTIDETTAVDLTFRAVSGPYSDATKPTVGTRPDRLIPVYRYSGGDLVAAAGVLTNDDPRRTELIVLPPLVDDQRGSLEIALDASLATAVLDGLEVLNDRDGMVACSFAVANRLYPNAATLTALDTLSLDRPDLRALLNAAIPAQIDRLVADQNGDGGWGWCSATRADEIMTASALLALAQAQEAGHTVPRTTMRAGARALQGWFTADVTTTETANRQALLLWARARAGDEISADRALLLANGPDLFDPYALALLVLGFEDTASPDATALLSRIEQSAVISVTGVHWEASEAGWINWNSDIRSTAIILQALLQSRPDSQLLPGAVRWLMAARSGQFWTNDYETAWSLVALGNWIAQSGELDAAFDYDVWLNRELVQDGRFDQAAPTTTQRQHIPITALTSADLNWLELVRDGTGNLYYTTRLNAFISAENLEPVSDRGFVVTRAYYDAACDPAESVCEPLTRFSAGQPVRVELTIIASRHSRQVIIEDPFPAGADGIDPTLDTSPRRFTAGRETHSNRYLYGYWGWWAFDRIEFRDQKVVFSADQLPAGTYQYTYYLQPIVPGSWQVPPTLAWQTFRSEQFGRSAGTLFEITP